MRSLTFVKELFADYLAEAYGKTGRIEEGLSVLSDQLSVRLNEIGDYFFDSELYRLKGELLLKQAIPDERQTEDCFRQAIDISRRHSAKSLELRAVMSLSRLLQNQGKKEEARQMLSEVYGWFTEGFDTKDLTEAKALLGELS